MLISSPVLNLKVKHLYCCHVNYHLLLVRKLELVKCQVLLLKLALKFCTLKRFGYSIYLSLFLWKHQLMLCFVFYFFNEGGRSHGFGKCYVCHSCRESSWSKAVWNLSTGATGGIYSRKSCSWLFSGLVVVLIGCDKKVSGLPGKAGMWEWNTWQSVVIAGCNLIQLYWVLESPIIALARERYLKPLQL